MYRVFVMLGHFQFNSYILVYLLRNRVCIKRHISLKSMGWALSPRCPISRKMMSVNWRSEDWSPSSSRNSRVGVKQGVRHMSRKCCLPRQLSHHQHLIQESGEFTTCLGKQDLSVWYRRTEDIETVSTPSDYSVKRRTVKRRKLGDLSDALIPDAWGST